ncbi:putative cryptic C4-dicarboxylate transporter DcuD [invertebrate metagenome]|uniref:Putative cryptic C4-dicarboxylate transporter DcuD n=1 Tax=invertebrate metagenome TaxID=1711999 RepID=A0A2H9T3Z8_9ZZZZ
MDILFTLIVVALVAASMLKRFNPQATLISAGLALLIYAQWSGVAQILPADHQQGLMFFDLWQKFTEITNNRLGAVGLSLVSIAGVSTYMSHIGASQAMVRLTSKPVMAIGSPWVLLGITLVFVSILYVFITGATSLSLLLMGTLYPVLRNAGLSAKTAIATIVIPTAWEYGPAQINAVIGAQAIHTDLMNFVIYHQSVIQIVLLACIPLINILWQRRCDRKEGYDVMAERGHYLAEQEDDEDEISAPGYYALLPLLPFVFLFGFSELFVDGIKISIPTAMMCTISLSVLVEIIRYRSVKTAFNHFDAWLKGTGMIFASVITLMVAAEFFASGLTNIGAIDKLIGAASSMSMGPAGISIVFSVFIMLTAFITGSGNAPVMAFIPIVPAIAAQFNVNPLLTLVPILFAAGIGRTLSPVAGVIITVAGMAKLNPVDVVKRTSVPMISSIILVLLISIVRYA